MKQAIRVKRTASKTGAPPEIGRDARPAVPAATTVGRPAGAPTAAGAAQWIDAWRYPLVVFASCGDNITPPHQALGWIPAVYADTDDLKQAGQRIVYLTNPHVGHLGIFASSEVARFAHRAILESLDAIEALEPGLYEMTIANPSGDPECHQPQYSVRFEERTSRHSAFRTRTRRSSAPARCRRSTRRCIALFSARGSGCSRTRGQPKS